MKKYKIVNGTKFCEACGNKNEILPIGSYEGDTGQQQAEYVCINKECSWGELERGANKQKSCDHKYITGLFRSGDCIKCGRGTPSFY